MSDVDKIIQVWRLRVLERDNEIELLNAEIERLETEYERLKKLAAPVWLNTEDEE